MKIAKASLAAPRPDATSTAPVPPKIAAHFADRPKAAFGPVAGLAAVASIRPRQSLATRKAFDDATQAASKGSGAPEVKFLIDRQTRKVYFLTPPTEYHFDFAQKFLGVRGELEDFNAITYDTPSRRYIAGTITAYDNYGADGTYALSYWSTDRAGADLIAETMGYLKKGLPFAKDKLVYRPGGETQEQMLRDGDKTKLDAAGVPVLTNDELSKNFKFMPLFQGNAVGTLRIIHGDGSNEPPAKRGEIVIYADQVPQDPLPSAGMLTPLPQTFLSHAALKARQDKTPYAYARDLLADPNVIANVGKLVRLEVTGNGFKLVPATQQEADAHQDGLRPKHPQKQKIDRSVKDITPLSKIDFSRAGAFGTKATNVAEMFALNKAGVLEADVPDGYGVPADMFCTFMETAMYDATRTFKQRLGEMLADPKFAADVGEREKQLKDFQKAIEKTNMPAALQKKVDKLEADFAKKFPGENMRIRSSSNSEDLDGFSGAGLFDSYTFRYADKSKPGKSLAERLQKTFASAWNLRAYEELDFYRIDVTSVAMSCLITPNEDDEIANGVVRWGGGKPGWETITVNAQVGESLVTNPDPNAVPDSLIVGNFGFKGELEIEYQTRSNQKLASGRKTVLTDDELRALHREIKAVQAHFARLYGREGDGTFSIECEFKIDSQGRMIIKQARPWVA